MTRALHVAVLAWTLAVLSSSAAARDLCPAASGPLSVFAVGGSTMGSVLGPLLHGGLARRGVVMNRSATASSGLARPDFHDWFALTPKLMDRYDPDIVVISLGGNDAQALRHDGGWIRLDDPRWEEEYAARVDALLLAAAGPERERLVVWVGPHAFVDWRAEERAPIIDRIMRERIEAFVADEGRAVFIDVFEATLGPNGRPLKQARLTEGGRAELIHTPDGLHLNARAVRAFMVRPILDVIQLCLVAPKVPTEGEAATVADAPPPVEPLPREAEPTERRERLEPWESREAP